jgi:hypothetical protein
MERWRSQTNLISTVFALLLFLSPWMLGYAGEAAAWNAWIGGALLAVLSARAVVAFAEWEEWIELALGIWILASPWVLKFAAGSSASKVHVMVGAVVTLLAAVELWKEHHVPQANA